MPDVLRESHSAPVPHRLSSPIVRIDPITQRHLDECVAVAERDAFARGEEAGRKSAERAAERAASAIVGALDRWTDEVRDQRRAATARNLELVERVSRAVIGQSPPASATVVVDRLRDTVDQLRTDALTVRVHPDDADAVTAVFASQAMTTSLQVVADARLAPGDAVVDGGHCGADLTRDTLLRIAVDLLAEEPDTGGAR